MSALNDALQNADQLFDENRYQEALDELKNCTVSAQLFLLFCLICGDFGCGSRSHNK